MMPVSVVASWRLWAIPLLVAAVTGYAVWFVQAVRLDNVRLESARHKAELRSELEAARAAAQEAARAQEQIFQTRIHEATHAHQQTLARVRADHRAARTELDRLRVTLAGYNRRASESTTTQCGTDETAPLVEVVERCATRHQEVARDAQLDAEQVIGLQNYVKAIAPICIAPDQ